MRILHLVDMPVAMVEAICPEGDEEHLEKQEF